MRGRIATLSTLCQRFAAALRHAPAPAFLALGRLFADLAPMEKRVDLHVGLLRRDAFREMECVSDVLKVLAQFEHLAEAYFTWDGIEAAEVGEREVGMGRVVECDLEVVMAAVGLVRTSVGAVVKDDGEWGWCLRRLEVES